MARIDLNRVEYITKQRNTVQDLVIVSYTTFVKDEKKYFQMETYGREERKTPGTTSQTIQMDKESAKVLIDLFQKEFCL